MTELRYTEQHEWVRIEGDIATIGISNFAQEQLGDVVFVELPDVGKEIAQFAEAAVVESVKAASEVYSPMTGEVTEVNDQLAEDPSIVNSDATGAGWFAKLKIAAASEADKLMTEEQYQAFVKELG